MFEMISYTSAPWLAIVAWWLALGCGALTLAAWVSQTRRDLGATSEGLGTSDRWALLGLSLSVPVLAWPSFSGEGPRAYLGHDSELLQSLLQQSNLSVLSLPALPGEPTGTVGRLFLFFAVLVDRVGQVLGPLVPEALQFLLVDRGVYWPPAVLLVGILGAWAAYLMARSWGGGVTASAASAVLALSAPAFLFHSNTLGDYLAGGVVFALALHLQVRRFALGRLLTPVALVEGVALIGAAFYLRYTALLLLVPLVVARLLVSAPLGRRLSHAVGLGAGTLLVVLPELPRINVLAEIQGTNHIFREYGAESVGVMSLGNLVSNFNAPSLAGYLAPLLGPGLGGLLLVGLWTMWKSRRSGATLAVLVLGTLMAQVVVTYLHIHPGSRSLLALLFWAAVPMAHGIAFLGGVSGPGLLFRRGILAGLLLAGGWQIGQSNRGLRGDWSEQASADFARRSAGVSVLPHSEVVSVLKEWGEGGSVHVICNSHTNPLDNAIPPDREHELMRGCFSLPIVTGSPRFLAHRTLYITEPADFRWSASFRRDYFTQIASSFTLQPVFRFDGRLAFSVTAKGQDPPPFPSWTP